MEPSGRTSLQASAVSYTGLVTPPPNVPAWTMQPGFCRGLYRRETKLWPSSCTRWAHFRISLQKGMRSTQVTWVGVRFTVTPDHVVVGLPEKFVKDLTTRAWWPSRSFGKLQDASHGCREYCPGHDGWLPLSTGSCTRGWMTSPRAPKQQDDQIAETPGPRIISSRPSSWNSPDNGCWPTSKQPCCALPASTSWMSTCTRRQE